MCSPEGILDFPIQNNVAISSVLNDSIPGNIPLDVQWAQRSTAPSFESNSIFLREGDKGQGSQSTTLRLQGNSYSLQTVQIVQPLHTKFMNASSQNSVQGEVLMIFGRRSALGNTYVIFAIPLVAGGNSSPSEYLSSLQNDRLPGRPISLENLIPPSREYTSYTTCVQQIQQNKSTPTQVHVFVFRNGLIYDEAGLREIREKSQGRGAQSFGTFQLPDNLQARTQSRVFTITSEADYKSFLRTGTLSRNTAATTQDGNKRTDTTSSYKCVPLNPDQNVRDGKIVIDTDKGVPLSQVLAEKIDGDTPSGGITPGDVEKIVAILVGTVIGIFILSIIAYVITIYTSKNAADNWPWLRLQTSSLLPIVMVAILMGGMGFAIGFIVK
jgi:hypothetical protein